MGITRVSKHLVEVLRNTYFSPHGESLLFCLDPGLSYATRVAPATIQWLIKNYETAEGVSLPRSTLYGHYQKHWYLSELIF